MSSKADRGNAERAAEHWLRSRGCIVTVRAVRAKWQRQDLFASDVIGKQAGGQMIFCQATAGQDAAVTARRRKLEAIPWARSDEVYIAQLRAIQDPANKRRKKYFFRVLEYAHDRGFSGKREWVVWEEAVEIPREWFQCVKKS